MGKKITAGNVKLKRAYEPPDAGDGTRVLIDRLRALARQGPITLVYSAHDEVHHDAVALRDFHLGRQSTRKPKTALAAA